MPETKTREAVKVPIGGLWEFTEWEIVFDHDVDELCGTEPCPHCYGFYVEHATDSDRTMFERRHWICPRVIVVQNEAGCNTTGLCLDCVLDAVKKLDASHG